MNKLFCRSFLSIYHLLPKLVKSIDKLILIRGVNSSVYTVNSGVNLENEVNKIINLTQRKINLINVKVLIDEVLVELKPKYSKLIITKYIDLVETKKAIELSNLNRRTYYRLLNKAIEEFERLLSNKIVNNKKLYNCFYEETLFNEILNKLCSLQQKTCSSESFEIKNLSNSICNFIVSKLNTAV